MIDKKLFFRYNIIKMKKQSLLLIIIGILLFISGLLTAIILQARLDMVPEAAIQPSITPSNDEPIVGGDRDEHGCIPSAGYTWCEAKQKCLRAWEEDCSAPKTDAEQIKEVLVAKYDWDADNIVLTVRTNDGQYASGGVREINALAGGGMWFAAKVDGQWQIVSDGNGTAMCSDLTAYPDFPSDLIPECWDEVSQKMIQR